MINVSELQKQLEGYRNDMKATIENRDRLVGMINQQEARLQQLTGAISVLEKIVKEEAENVGQENNGTNPAQG